MTGDEFRALCVPATLTLHEALAALNRTARGVLLVLHDDGRLRRTLTDGDLRRLLETGHDFTKFKLADVMHANPRTVHPDQLAVETVEVMEQFRINQLLVADSDGKLVGALHIHDLTRAKVI